MTKQSWRVELGKGISENEERSDLQRESGISETEEREFV
jgi:hypothetical protein